MSARTRYTQFTKKVSKLTGRSSTFITAIFLMIVWLMSGPYFDFSNSWQLVINTSTTIITFIMVFVIQNTQNRDTEAMQVKLDELIRVTQGAHNELLDLEELEEEAIGIFRERYQVIAREARVQLGLGEYDTDTPNTIK
jgi:low affinity Fe/Cu permease